MDTQGSLTHIAVIFKFGDVSGPRAKKSPKVNHGLKIVKRLFPPVKGLFVGVCVRLLRRMYLLMYWEFFTHLQLMRGWNR